MKFKLSKSRETFSFKPPISFYGSWMLGLTSFEVYISIFNVTENNNKFQLYVDNFDEFSFEELKDELEEILSTSDITLSRLQHEKIGPRIIQIYKKLGSEKSSTDSYFMLLMGYARSLFEILKVVSELWLEWMKRIFN